MKLVWAVSMKGGSSWLIKYRPKVVWKSFNDAWVFFKTLDWKDIKLIYPKFVKDAYWDGLKDFEGV
jgi:hypothetical protein